MPFDASEPPLGEAAFLKWLAGSERPPKALRVPLGDDAAVWRLSSGEDLVLTADALAEGTHFERGTDPRLVGRKALAVNLSDLAAMGASPLCALATCALPRGFAPSLPRALVKGLRELGAIFSCPLVGGDTISHQGELVLSVSVLGRLLPRGPIRRDTAQAGDLIAVTGAIGGSGRGRHLIFQPRLRESQRLLEAGPPSAMMDISDGLLLDLYRMAEASGTGFLLHGNRVPLHAEVREDPLRALAEGEDFELLVCARPRVMAAMVDAFSGAVPLTVVGEMRAEPGGLLELEGRLLEAPRRGYEHH